MDQVLVCHSQYVTLHDGTRLAVSYWLYNKDLNSPQNYPVVLVTTRYWRTLAFACDSPELQGYYPWALKLAQNGYRLIVADARGTGASFGSRSAEVDRTEVQDIGELIHWVAQQDWCDGRVATHGTSYSGITTLYSLATAPDPLKIGVCRAPDVDMYRHLMAPGGIVNHWFIEGWGAHTAAQDANDVETMFACGYTSPPVEGADNILGVRPVDQDHNSQLLAAAVAEHADNFNIAAEQKPLAFIENFWTDNNPAVFDTRYYNTLNKSGISLAIRCGWHDAATQLGALAFYNTFDQLPVQIILGPWNHEGTYYIDPFKEGDGTNPDQLPLDEGYDWRVEYFDRIFKSDSTAQLERQVRYYTLGENRWKTTDQWPLPNSELQRFYFASNHQLSTDKPQALEGSDHYLVDPSASSGTYNRWYAQASDQPVYFPDRQEDDKKLLVYDSLPLETDIEITGHPVVHLYLRSSATDGQLFVYLETIDPDGRVRWLTDGQLRAIHRKVSSDQPPYAMFGPYHRLTEEDAEPLIPGELSSISFDLLPISVRLAKGQRIRVAIAGADKDTFLPLAGCENPELEIERNRQWASHIELPIVKE